MYIAIEAAILFSDYVENKCDDETRKQKSRDVLY